ncbi:ComEA family DNA-binding protein [Halomonas caseinilytica]|uniref:Competence protein ComEA n=1 Tax=Halomonas caseinilytica TaxID=438744 RepID=A0A1M6TPY2_9GAMM|nr:helix-hairpin-helix domain-containing protein [Halomonas caseinilytica]SEN42332.1 competence protein ComEA [Halomonas caseinilytica]SHK58868.1 competence protein ComEA [Halomonas caseinilytica]
MHIDIKGLTTSLGLALLLGIAQPTLAEDSSDTSTTDPASTAEPASTSAEHLGIAPIDINTADATLLTELPGIGEVKASAIVEDRDANGPFENADDLTRVKGIGEATVEALKDEVTY